MKKLLQYPVLSLTVILAGCAATPAGTALPQSGSAAAVPVNPSAVAQTHAAGAAVQAANANSLTELLVSQLGVTEQQATGGAGAIFELAKHNMTAADFSKLSAAVPGMSGLLSAAPALSGAAGGSGGGLLGTATGMMGGQTGSLGSLATLASAFQGLGMNGGMASQFLPVVLQYVQAQGGLSTMSLLKAALL